MNSDVILPSYFAAWTSGQPPSASGRFWLPGQFASLAATPVTPGWSWATIYLHTDVSSGAGQQFPRGGRVDVGIAGRGDLVAYGPTYVFATPVLGAQASVSVLGIAGRNNASAALSLTGPLGNTIALDRSQGLTSYGDVIVQTALNWNHGVHNTMVYGMGDIPIGDYDPSRLANLGLGHGAIDDFGAPAALGGFRSRVAAVGAQIGFLFPVGDLQGYQNIKGYKEFAAENRPEGFNTWVTFAISPKTPEHTPTPPRYRK